MDPEMAAQVAWSRIPYRTLEAFVLTRASNTVLYGIPSRNFIHALGTKI